MDKKENRDIRERMKVTELHKKIQEKRLRWYGHILRRDEYHVTRKSMDLRVEGKRKRGRPQRRWMDCLKEDLEERELTEHDAADRQRWRFMTRSDDPT